MSEDFLHYIWKFKQFDLSGLCTTDNEPVEILKAGEHNFDAGPDFFNAKLRIGETLWAGNVEVHIKASDWNRHGHQTDKAYDNIILHAVYDADHDLKRSTGEKIPTIEMKSRIPLKHFQKYMNFKQSKDWIPCEKQIKEVPDLIVNGMLDKMVLERLEKRSIHISNSLKLNHNNWEETFYQALARNFGFKTNADTFELLAKSLPSLIPAKQKSSFLQVEALIFGQAGMLEEHYKDKYPISLQNEYVFLQKKFQLQPLPIHLWKYLRLRPINFPSIRLAQFASLIYHSSNLFSSILERENLNDMKALFDITVSEYWETHYTFDKSSKMRSKRMGDEASNNIIMNTIVPFLFVYGKQKAEEEHIERALRLLEQLPGESNTIISNWKNLGINVNSAQNTQALLQLKNEYCQNKKCLNCNIGNYILKNS